MIRAVSNFCSVWAIYFVHTFAEFLSSQTLTWRRENGIDTLASEPISPFCDANFPVSIEGRDRVGRPCKKQNDVHEFHKMHIYLIVNSPHCQWWLCPWDAGIWNKPTRMMSVPLNFEDTISKCVNVLWRRFDERMSNKRVTFRLHSTRSSTTGKDSHAAQCSAFPVRKEDEQIYLFIIVYLLTKHMILI